jgi:hypothetical protein
MPTTDGLPTPRQQNYSSIFCLARDHLRRVLGGWELCVEPLAIGAIGAVFVALIGAAGYLFRDNQRLRSIIHRLEVERDELLRRVQAAEATSYALLDVMKGVMRGEIATARTEERAHLFENAYNQLVAIERGDVNVTVVGGGSEVGQVSGGRGNEQTRTHE